MHLQWEMNYTISSQCHDVKKKQPSLEFEVANLDANESIYYLGHNPVWGSNPLRRLVTLVAKTENICLPINFTAVLL